MILMFRFNVNNTFLNRPDRVAWLAKHWASIPRIVGSNPTVVRYIFKLVRSGVIHFPGLIQILFSLF